MIPVTDKAYFLIDKGKYKHYAGLYVVVMFECPDGTYSCYVYYADDILLGVDYFAASNLIA